MKKVSYVFWTLVAGIGLSFVGSVYTAVTMERPQEVPPGAIPVPAEAPKQ